ncbi:MAG: LytTR family DNA-binding domain-containing protein [Lachnospiraceae bacterium]|nr:LytTR family DNA-binding domain-containing protein [Lachnospiraceae bacterium]MDE7331865.1 LytTR family DNA-binding domain-containing protein [Lachnospiraceae bacterium]
MISVAVCDDSVIECCRIAGRIKELLDEMGVPCLVRQFNSGKELLQAQENFDIIFLDIIMDELDGMKTAVSFRRENPDTVLVFVTSSRKYVFDAYEVEAFWYLLKPLEDKKLRKVLGRAVQKTGREEQDFLIINKERQKKKLFLKDIYYFEIKGRLIYVHGKGEAFAFYEQIGTLENSLLGRGFFRCHKSYLVNLKYVNVYNRQEITLDNGERIILAKRRYEEFCQEFLKYMRTNGGIV